MYVTELAQITPSAANYKYYLEIIKRDSVNRSLIRAARDIAEQSNQIFADRLLVCQGV